MFHNSRAAVLPFLLQLVVVQGASSHGAEVFHSSDTDGGEIIWSPATDDNKSVHHSYINSTANRVPPIRILPA
eukprot:COSAG01_NODE_53478_length_339_cov_0.458333_1_plen_72_part_01